MKKTVLAGALIILPLLTVNVQAQQQSGGGTPRDQQACEPDVKRLCPRLVRSGDFVILGCLQTNRVKLSKPCNGVLASYGL